MIYELYINNRLGYLAKEKTPTSFDTGVLKNYSKLIQSRNEELK